jgi:hypothetical protein
VLLVLGVGCHLFFKKLGLHLLLVRVHVRPGKCMKHLPGVSMRHDARSCPTAEYRQTARRTAEYRLVGGGTAECRQPTGGLARGGAGGNRATRGDGDLRQESGVCVFSHRQSGPVPAFLSFGVPDRTPGGRGWPGLSGWIKGLFRGKMRNRGRDWTK